MKILITGGTGFLGRALQRQLAGHEVMAVGRNGGDLCHPATAEIMLNKFRPDVVYHLAAVVGGIGANMRRPGDFWRENMLMGVNVLEACRFVGVKKVILVGTTCSYPERPKTIPFIEEELFAGYPEPTNAPYGIAKRALLEGGRAYRDQYGLDVVSCIPTNLYGPGDNFDPNTSHVIPALMRKLHTARSSDHYRTTGNVKVILWGSGRATRDFLYVEDAAAGLALMANYDGRAGSINLGSGGEVSIRWIVSDIAMAMGIDPHTLEILWDHSKPDGQPRRVLNCDKAKRYLGWESKTTLLDGLRKTYEWYLKEVKK